MKYLELYPEPQLAIVETVEGEEVTSTCVSCNLHESCKSVCLAPEGSEETGGLLVVCDHPLIADDAKGRPHSSKLGYQLRRFLRDQYSGPIYLDYAVKCAPKVGKKVGKVAIRSCRPYLAQTIAECKPSRIIAMGSTAMASLLGRSAGPFSTRKAYGWLEETQTPVFVMMGHYSALNNRFLKKWFEEDFQWALSVDKKHLREMSSRDGVASVITTKEESEQAIEILRSFEWVAYDTETVGHLFNDDFEIVSLSISGKYSEDAYVWSIDELRDPDIVQPVLEFMKDPSVLKVAQNAKYDANAFYSAYDIHVQGLYLDTRLVRKLLEPESMAKLEVLQEQVGMGGGKEIALNAIDDVSAKISKAETDVELSAIGPLAWTKQLKKPAGPAMGVYAYGLMDTEVRDRYCARDTVSTARVAELYEERLKESSIGVVWKDIMLPAAQAIEYVEQWGVAVDRHFADKFDHIVKEELHETKCRIYAQGQVNINSTADLCEILYTRLKLPVVAKTGKGKPSTDRATLETLAGLDNLKKDQKEFLEAMLAYRKLSKLHSSYSTKLGGFIRDDGRVHPSFNLVGARSGRISCSDPNVQQIPRADNKIAAMARDCFVAPKGRVLVQVDYSQLELRIAAMLSNDTNMIDVFKSGEDYHLRTAQLISKQAWGIAPEEVTKVHRTAAKSVNFGLLYGMSIGTLAKNIGCEKHEADKIQSAVFGSFPNLKRWCDEHVQIARRTGNGYTYWNGEKARIRPLFRIADQDDLSRKTAENGSFNTPVQGTASDICLASLARCVNWILEHNFPAKMVLTVHDSLLFEVDEDCVDELVETAQYLMADWESNGVPLVVDAEVGKSWGSLKNYD